MLTFVAIVLALFLPAGTLNYWEAWTFMGVFFIPAIFVIFYFLKHDREFLERRLKFREKETQEKIFIKIAQLLFFIGFLMPGFDRRYEWSNVPFWLVISLDTVVFSAYIAVFFVFKENSYASRIVKVDRKQEVITTGPYAIVRHPMYAVVIPMFLCIPFALGSYFALIFFVSTVPVILFRILDEERLLLRDLKGYKEYTKKVKYRLIPLSGRTFFYF